MPCNPPDCKTYQCSTSHNPERRTQLLVISEYLVVCKPTKSSTCTSKGIERTTEKNTVYIYLCLEGIGNLISFLGKHLLLPIILGPPPTSRKCANSIVCSSWHQNPSKNLDIPKIEDSFNILTLPILTKLNSKTVLPPAKA